MANQRGKYLVQLSLQTLERKRQDENNNTIDNQSSTSGYDKIRIQGQTIVQKYVTENSKEATKDLDLTCHESDLSDYEDKENEESGTSENYSFDLDDDINDPDWDEYEFRNGKRKIKVVSSESDECFDKTVKRKRKVRKTKKQHSLKQKSDGQKSIACTGVSVVNIDILAQNYHDQKLSQESKLINEDDHILPLEDTLTDGSEGKMMQGEFQADKPEQIVTQKGVTSDRGQIVTNEAIACEQIVTQKEIVCEQIVTREEVLTNEHEQIVTQEEIIAHDSYQIVTQELVTRSEPGQIVTPETITCDQIVTQGEVLINEPEQIVTKEVTTTCEHGQIVTQVIIHQSEQTSTQEVLSHELEHIVEEIISTDETVETKTRAKQGQADPEIWEKNFQKKQRMQGKKYKGVAKNDEGKNTYKVERNERIMIEKTCSKRCEKSKMCHKVSESQRKKIFQMFWNTMNWDEKRMYANGLVDKCVPQSKIEGSRKTQTLKYNLKIDGQQFVVCKGLFLSTLGIGEKMLYGWLNEDSDKSQNSQTKERYVSEGMKQARIFLQSLPRMPSHYCRSSSSKEYLEPVFESMHHLYRVYKQFCVESQVDNVCIQSFKRAFIDLNLALFQPRKDQCDLCCGYNTGNVCDKVYSEHIIRKNEAREEKVKDKSKAIEHDNVKVITVDMQSTLLSSKLKASSLYYKMKLCCHNYTVYDLATKEVLCYFWHEGEFGVTADAFASCLVDYIKSIIEPSLLEIVIFSDGCCYQNRNVTLANALLAISIEHNITITQKYLEKGHTQMEVDSVHSTIERKLRNKDIFVPANYVEYIQKARLEHPYKVKYLTYSFFKDYSSLKYYNSIRPGLNSGDAVVTDIRVLRYKPSGEITYKLHFSDQFRDVPKRTTRLTSTDQGEVVQLKSPSGPLKIKRTKYQHLQQLKKVLAKDYHSFYDNLLQADN